MPSFDEPADALYALRPADFTAGRIAAVKAAREQGARELAAELAALRKPSSPAWLVNLLVRHDPETVETFLGLGDLLREAQRDMQGEKLRSLNQERQRTVTALAERARQLGSAAGTHVRDDAVREVAETLSSALADPDTAAAVRRGRLTSSASYSGLGLAADGADAASPEPGTAGRSRGGAGSGRQRAAAKGTARRHADADAVVTAERERAAAERELAARAERIQAAETEREAAAEASSRADVAAEQAAALRTEGRRRLDELRRAVTEAEAESASLSALAEQRGRDRAEAVRRERDAEQGLERARSGD